MNYRKYFFIVLSILYAIPIFSQENGMGWIYDPETDGKMPIRPNLETRDYTVLPQQYSLKQYCPHPRSQGPHGTCVSWATAYAARTMLEAIKYGWTNTDSITQEAFAPIFIYKQLTNSADCQGGTNIWNSLSIMVKKGVPKLNSFNVLCADYIPDSLFLLARKYKLGGGYRLFDQAGYSHEKIQKVKKALTQNFPVIIGMDIYKSFYVYGKDIWDGVHDYYDGSHAMCVVGYDDNKYGGAFEIMNSWGRYFGDGGFIWVRYEDFCGAVDFACDVYLKQDPIPDPEPLPNPEPEPKPVPDTLNIKHYFSGDINIVERDGGNITNVTLDTSSGIPHYVTSEPFYSGKKIRLSVCNNKAAWVYVISSDSQNNITKLFPYADNICAYLNYTQSHIAIPDESHEFKLDSIAGTDYFCVLYSENELNINNLVEQFSVLEGSFYDKLKIVLGNSLAPYEDIHYVKDKIMFDAKTNKTIVPLILEIQHKDIPIIYK